MNKDITKSTEILFDLVTNLEPRLATLHDWFFELVSTIDKWSRSEGNQGVKRAKDILSQGLLAIFGEETETLKFVSSKDGIPTLVQPLVSRVKALKADARLLSGVISLTRVTDLWVGKPQDSTVLDQLRVITTSQLSNQAPDIIKEFSEFLKSFLNTYPNHPVVKAYKRAIYLSDEDTAMYSESIGPNGRLTANAHKDVVSLRDAVTIDGRTLLSAIEELQSSICNQSSFSFKCQTRFSNEVLASEQLVNLEHNECPGKLNYIPEKSGKVRIIAQPDYFSQLSLRPVHRWTFNVLKGFPSDCTFDQRSAIPKISEWHTEGSYVASFDQSSCTDLFPFEIQLIVLENRFGDHLAESVKTVMSDREWSITLPSGRTQKVRWSVGQPMGMLLSWPLMALTHHFLVQYSHWRASGKSFPRKGPFSKYVICGDDIVIGDKSVADSYRHVVKSLGMKINTSKSHISGRGTDIPPISEFAKIIIWKGQPLFPIRPNMVLTSVKDWRYAVPLFIDIANVDGFSARMKFIERVIKKHYATRHRFLIPLLTIPRELGGVGYRDSVSLKNKFRLIQTGQIHPFLYFLALKVRSGLMLENRALILEELPDDMTTAVMSEHPLTLYAKALRNKLSHLGMIQDVVPSPRTIIIEMLQDGIRSYDRFLIPGQSNGVLPHWDETELKDQLYQRTLWEKALRKPIKLSQAEVEDISQIYSARVQEQTISEATEAPAEGFNLSQYDLVRSVMLAVRSI